jgi:adenylate cyclase, class 2
MADRSTTQEVEIKLPVSDLAEFRTRIVRARFRESSPRVFEANVVFDTPEKQLRQSRELLRLRQVGSRFILTYKGPPSPGRHKSREELEQQLHSGEPFTTILARLGFLPVFRYEKYRAEFTRPSEQGTLTLDETPIGNFIELEGPPDWIDTVAADLGFTGDDYITASYGTLFLEHRERTGSTAEHMVFGEPAE